MFGTSGIRGPVGKTVTADLALSVGRALGAETDRVVVGRDPRESGELLTDALTAGLRETGTDAVDLGLAATPTVARAVAWEDCDAGVSVTASHNPAEDNGIKLWQPSGQAFDGPMQDRITERVRAADWSLQQWDGLGGRERADGFERHVETLVDRADLGDADRMRAVAGDGTYLSGDALLAVFAGAAVESGDRVAVPVDTSLAVEDYLTDRGATVERTPVGDVYVAAAVAEGAAFGGEPSGSWMWGEETLCPDGPLAAVKVAELAADRPLADRAGEVPEYPIRRASVETDAKARAMATVAARVQADYDDVSTMDGVRVWTEDGWFLVRSSGTQPIVRITAEARDDGRAEELFEEAQSLVDEAVGEN